MANLYEILFGKKVELGKRINISTHVFGKPLREGEYYKISGYHGTFKLEREQDFNHSAYMRATFIRENALKNHAGKIPKLTYIPKKFASMY